MQQIDVAQVQAHLFNLLEPAASGNEVVITKDNHPFVKTVPMVQCTPRPSLVEYSELTK